MSKVNPVVALARRKGKGRKVKKGDFLCPVCGEEFDDFDDFDEHLEEEKEYRGKMKDKLLDIDEDECEDEFKMIKNANRQKIRKSVEREILRRLRKAEDDEDDFEEEDFEEEDDELDEDILDKLAEISEKLDKILNAKAPVEDEEEFEDVDIEHSVRAKKNVKPVRKKEERHKPREATSPVDTGEDEREVEEDDFSDFEEQGDESPERADRNALHAEKANYKNEAGKAKELPPKAQLSQKVVFNDTTPSQSSASRAASKSTRVAQIGKAPENVSSYTTEEYISSNDVNKSSSVSDILLGKKKASEVMKEIREIKKSVAGESSNAFGEYGTIGGI